MASPDSRVGSPARDATDREHAFDALFRRHYYALCRFAARIMGTSAEAEEVVQEVFMFVWERHDVITDATPPSAYLYRAVHNTALNRVRHGRVERRWAEGEGRVHKEPCAAAEALVEQEELALAVRRVIEQLPERTRLVYTLSRQDQLTYAEIAATLGISVKTVEAQMTRALRRLRLALAPFLTSVLLLVL